MTVTNMGLSDEEIKSSLEILKALEEAIDKGPWEHNLFFKGIGKKLRDARDKFKDELGLDAYLAGVSKGNQNEAVANAGVIEVYVSLYQAEGSNIAKWANVVNSLGGYNMTRPVYKSEADIQEAIRMKEFKQNDAYVAVKVQEQAVMKPLGGGKPLMDRSGHELINIREGAIRVENITRFVHNDITYKLLNGTLVKL